MALHELSVTMGRLESQGVPLREDGFAVPPDPVTNPLPNWMRELGSANFAVVLLRAPHAVSYMLAHPENLPNNIPKELDAAGLIERKDGEILFHHYSVDGVTPYGDPSAMLF